MTDKVKEFHATEKFVAALAPWMAERTTIRGLFFESRYEILEASYFESGSTLDFEGYLVKELKFDRKLHPWEKLIEQPHAEMNIWNSLFMNLLVSGDVCATFADYFSRYLFQIKRMKVALTWTKSGFAFVAL